MKFLIALTMGMCTAALANAQTGDSIKIDPRERPVSQDEKYWKELPRDLPPFNNMIEVSKDTLPVHIRKTLEHNELYKGWENSPIFLDKNTGLYMLYMKKDSTITTYGFNEKGKPVTYDSVTKKDR